MLINNNHDPPNSWGVVTQISDNKYAFEANMLWITPNATLSFPSLFPGGYLCPLWQPLIYVELCNRFLHYIHCNKSVEATSIKWKNYIPQYKDNCSHSSMTQMANNSVNLATCLLNALMPILQKASMTFDNDGYIHSEAIHFHGCNPFLCQSPPASFFLSFYMFH